MANARKIALDLGYSKKAIDRCYVSGMTAGDLVLKVLDLEESNPEYRYDDVEVIISEENELSRRLKSLDLEDKNIESLRDETLHLWKRMQCHSCWKNKSNRLPLPCTHLAVCENCISDKCIICNERVVDWIKIHM